MKTFACGSVMPGCEVQLVEDDEVGLLTKVAEHARADHGIDEIDDSTREQVLANVRPVERTVG